MQRWVAVWAAAVSLLFTELTCAASAPRNVLVLITDQERHAMHWPDGWAATHLPNMHRLQRSGLTFTRAYTAASMCSPARAAMLTSQFCPVNRMCETLDPTPPANTELPNQTLLDNVASVIAQSSHGAVDVVWKGKWHVSYAADGFERWGDDDVAAVRSRYGPRGWTPPDAGNADRGSYGWNATWALSTLGGGDAQNDARFVGTLNTSRSPRVRGWGEPALDYIRRVGRTPPARRKPFVLFVSLVNPHDVWVYPDGWERAGYTRAFARQAADIRLPTNRNDTLDTKPSVQRRLRDALNEASPLPNATAEREFAQFYAYLHTVVDEQLGLVLDALDAAGLTDDTLILRTADHGEMGMSHGLREKAYVAYEEALRVPLVVSNPRMFPPTNATTPVRTTEAFYSHLDLLPTVAEYAGVPPAALAGRVQGVSQRGVINGSAAELRDAAVFAFDDQMFLPADTPHSHLRALRHGQLGVCSLLLGWHRCVPQRHVRVRALRLGPRPRAAEEPHAYRGRAA